MQIHNIQPRVSTVHIKDMQQGSFISAGQQEAVAGHYDTSLFPACHKVHVSGTLVQRHAPSPNLHHALVIGVDAIL